MYLVCTHSVYCNCLDQLVFYFEFNVNNIKNYGIDTRKFTHLCEYFTLQTSVYERQGKLYICKHSEFNLITRIESLV
jgi:hypothetical protein